MFVSDRRLVAAIMTVVFSVWRRARMGRRAEV